MAAGFVLWFACLAPAADAQVSCSYAQAPLNELRVLVVGPSIMESAFAEISRRGVEIQVRELVSDEERRGVSCSGGVPSVVNTDRITISAHGDFAGVDVFLSGRPLAPGATPEPESASEIEIEAIGSDSLGSVVGTSGPDEFHWGTGGADVGLNLNPRQAGDRDVDVTLRGNAGFTADGGAGDDTIIPGPGAVAGSFVFANGGRGNDRLAAPPNTASVMIGGSGRDWLSGGRRGDLLEGGIGDDRVAGGRDTIRGGRGRDTLLGGRGRDAIGSRDGQRDTVRCGPHRDRVNADRRDLLRGCERIRRR